MQSTWNIALPVHRSCITNTVEAGEGGTGTSVLYLTLVLNGCSSAPPEEAKYPRHGAPCELMLSCKKDSPSK